MVSICSKTIRSKTIGSKIAFVLMLFLLLSLMAGSYGCDKAPGLMEYRQTRSIMDTFVTVTVVTDDQKHATETLDAVFEEFRRIEKKFTIFDHSPLSELNQKGYLETDDQEFLRILRKAYYYSQITEGYFDMTVQPILDLYTRSFSATGSPPTQEDIDSALRSVGYMNVIITDSSVTLHNDTKLTLNALVKGYAVDSAIDIILEHNISSALVNAGGDLRAIGKKPDGSLWSIALANPDNTQEFLTVIDADNIAVATSGNYERYFDPSRRFHHIVDPHTGYSAQGLISVTIIAPTASQADALATAVFVMGKEKGLDLIQRLETVEALLVTEDRELVYSSSYPR